MMIWRIAEGLALTPRPITYAKDADHLGQRRQAGRPFNLPDQRIYADRHPEPRKNQDDHGDFHSTEGRVFSNPEAKNGAMRNSARDCWFFPNSRILVF